MEYKFYLNNLRIAPRKVRLVANLIKKSSVLSAEAELRFQNKKASLPILKLLKSAVAGAANNFNLSSENLYITNILVDEGQKLKRFRPRAFGRTGAIHKKTSHITLILEERVITGNVKKKKRNIREIELEKSSFVKPDRQSAGGATEDKEKIEMVVPREIKPRQGLRGITKRIFRRKAIS